MKHTILILVAALAALTTLSSCTTGADGSNTFGNGKIDLNIDTAKVAKIGSTAIKLGELTGYVNPTQAEAIRSVGALVLKQDGSADAAVVAASRYAIEEAVRKGKITRAEADELYKMGTVPVTTSPPVAPATAAVVVPPAEAADPGQPLQSASE